MKSKKPGDIFNQHKALAMGRKPKRQGLKLNPPSKGHTPKGAHGRAAVQALGRTKTTGNFKKIAESKGRAAAIAAYQNALKAHKAGKKKRRKTKLSPGLRASVKNAISLRKFAGTSEPAFTRKGVGPVKISLEDYSRGAERLLGKVRDSKKKRMACKRHKRMNCKRC